MAVPPGSAPAVSPGAPPPAPPSPDEQTVRSTLDLAVTLGLVFALIAGLLFLILLALSILRAVLGTGYGGFVGAAYCLVSAVVNYLLWRELPAIVALLPARQYRAARDRLLLWMVLGFLFFVVEGIVLLFAWLKLDSMAHAAESTPPGGTSSQCPRCGGPLSWVAEYQRFYCYRCGAYA